MIYTKRQTSKGKTKTVELTKDTQFYTQCADCGKEVEATAEILDEFSEYIYGFRRIICESCAAKRRSAENANKKSRSRVMTHSEAAMKAKT